jgi:hypothetical protein
LVRIRDRWESSRIPEYFLSKAHLHEVSEVCEILSMTMSGSSETDVIKTKLHGPSSRANYTDRATVVCHRSYGQLLRIVWHTVSITDPYGRIIGFLDQKTDIIHIELIKNVSKLD